NNIRALFEDEEGFIWIATEDMGLNRLDPMTGTVAVIQKNDGLFEDGLHKMLLDDYGRMWFSSNQGIFWVQFDHLQQFANGNRNRVHSQYYNEQDGMLNREANGGFQNSGFKSKDGRLFFATQNGIVVIDPGQIDTQTTIQPVILDDFIVDGESIYTGDTETNLTKNQRSFSIQFTAPFFTTPDRIRYRYKLKDFDDDWNDAGSRREAIYTNVPAGTYQFSVTAGLGNEESTSIETTHAVIISPYYYETTWFSVTIFLLFGLVIAGGYRLRVRHLIRKENVLERMVAERTDDLRSEKIKTEEQAEQLRILAREKNRFFANISHEFRTPLTLIIGQIETLLDSESDRNKKLKLNSVNSNGKKLLSLINQLLDLSKLEAGKMELHTKKKNIISFLKNHLFSFESLAQAENISLYFSSARTNIVMNYDADKMEKVFFNL
ncbi:MAG: histidine kinase dimerization/phospho-acceptor domain-containing protein, partial [Salibacteraceae bacterium]